MGPRAANPGHQQPTPGGGGTVHRTNDQRAPDTALPRIALDRVAQPRLAASLLVGLEPSRFQLGNPTQPRFVRGARRFSGAHSRP